MKTATKRKPVPAIPTLAERMMALHEELLEAPAHERQELLTWWRSATDDALGDLAEARRNRGKEMVGATGEIETVGGIPVGWIKMQYHARGHGDCPCKAMAEALKDAS
jgi:hypothetical protein